MYQWHRRILRAFDVDAGIVGDGLSNIKAITGNTPNVTRELMGHADISTTMEYYC